MRVLIFHINNIKIIRCLISCSTNDCHLFNDQNHHHISNDQKWLIYQIGDHIGCLYGIFHYIGYWNKHSENLVFYMASTSIMNHTSGS